MKSNIAKFLIVVALLAGALPVWGKFSIELDSQSNVRGFVLDGKRLTLPTPYSYFELDGKLAEAGETNGAAGRRFQLNTGTAAGIMRVVEGVETSFHFEQAEGAKVKNLALVLTWPAAAELHLAEYLNVGRLLDRDMPPGETYQGGLRYNFFVVQAGGMCVRFRAEEKRWQLRSTIHVARHPEMFTVTFTWEAGTDLSVAGFGALREAVADHEQWLRKEAGMRPLAERAEAPAWVREVKLVVTADMMRSHWEIANDYQDLLNLAREISRIRNPREVLFYIPGWQGAYDAVHPDYRPHPDLGGAAKFKELTDYLHQAGFRLMIHTTGWGIDPYRTDIDVIEKIARRDEKGEMMGWQTPFPEAHPPRSPLKFKTPRIPLTPEAGLKSFAFTTDTVPAMCEALFTVGSNKPGKHRIRLTAGHRTLITPTGWFENHIEYQFPFPLMLAAGRNEVRVEVTGDGGWPGGWYQVRDTYVPPSPYHTWTHPILMADVTKPEYIRMFTDNLRSVVREYGIDAVHVDTSVFYQPAGGVTPPMRDVCMRLREALPGVALAAEWFRTYEEMNFWHLVQGARQSLKNYASTVRHPYHPSSVVPVEGIAALYAWLDKPSSVCDFSRKFIVVYPHLCAADAFVPVGKVCNVLPARQMPFVKEELWNVLRSAGRLNFTPGLRVNYRGYGLDADTRRAIQELR